MFQHTLDRADQITGPERKVTVIARSHREDAGSQLVSRQAGQVILQPLNRGTVAGVFLALTHVRALDSQGTVVLFPSDHFVHPESRFVEIVQRAVEAAQQMKQRLFLLGVASDSLEIDYGWISQGPDLGSSGGHRIRAVRSFVEKPTLEQCKIARASGALWNTLVLTVKVETLWAIGWSCVPEA
jgi:mannose-1-phosphate guanylyltransferase